MPCFRPLTPPEGRCRVPCGQCIGCRLERSRQWAVRCMHEASLYQSNCFITLTYDRKHLPRNGSLDLRHFQLFMMRLRKRFGRGIRFFHCGEYGEKLGRPHYHALLFNFDFSDKVLCNDDLFRSDSLDRIWGKGLCRIGEVSFESAAYVARYCTKKITGRKAFDHYAVLDFETGEVLSVRRPEYATMSRRPGLGAGWFRAFSADVYPKDSFHMRGRAMRPGRFYDRMYELVSPEDMELVKLKRSDDARLRWEDNVPSRLTAKALCNEVNVKQLSRSYEDGS